MRCALCDQPTAEGFGGVLRYVHLEEYSERGVRECANANLVMCASCSKRILKHMKRVLSASQLGVKKERIEEIRAAV